jgi:hypothetical protein
MKQTDRYIWKIEETDLALLGDPDVTGAGWYFVNEAELFEGPYSSRQEAIDVLASYATYLNTH